MQYSIYHVVAPRVLHFSIVHSLTLGVRGIENRYSKCGEPVCLKSESESRIDPLLQVEAVDIATITSIFTK